MNSTIKSCPPFWIRTVKDWCMCSIKANFIGREPDYFLGIMNEHRETFSYKKGNKFPLMYLSHNYPTVITLHSHLAVAGKIN